MTEVDSLGTEFVSLVRAIVSEFGGRLAVLRPEVSEAVEMGVEQLCAVLVSRFAEKREQISKLPPDEVAAAAQFMRNMRAGFLGAVNENRYVC